MADPTPRTSTSGKTSKKTPAKPPRAQSQPTGNATKSASGSPRRSSVAAGAARELARDVPGERDLAYILSDLVQTGKEDESVTLARAVQGNLVSYLRDRWRGVVNLGVKKGPFYVLVGAYMPCILVEVAFLTNETEGQRIAALIRPGMRVLVMPCSTGNTTSTSPSTLGGWPGALTETSVCWPR